MKGICKGTSSLRLRKAYESKNGKRKFRENPYIQTLDVVHADKFTAYHFLVLN